MSEPQSVILSPQSVVEIRLREVLKLYESQIERIEPLENREFRVYFTRAVDSNMMKLIKNSLGPVKDWNDKAVTVTARRIWYPVSDEQVAYLELAYRNLCSGSEGGTINGAGVKLSERGDLIERGFVKPLGNERYQLTPSGWAFLGKPAPIAAPGDTDDLYNFWLSLTIMQRVIVEKADRNARSGLSPNISRTYIVEDLNAPDGDIEALIDLGLLDIVEPGVYKATERASGLAKLYAGKLPPTPLFPASEITDELPQIEIDDVASVAEVRATAEAIVDHLAAEKSEIDQLRAELAAARQEAEDYRISNHNLRNDLAVAYLRRELQMIEIKTLIQSLPDWKPEEIARCDRQFADLLNDGWSVVNITVNGGDSWNTRVITFQRTITPQPQPEHTTTHATAAVTTPISMHGEEGALQNALNQPITAAIRAHGVEAVADLMDQHAISTAIAKFETFQIPVRPPLLLPS